MGTLLPEFRNTHILERYGIDLLAVESINIQKIRSEKWASDLYEAFTKVRRESLANDQNACAYVCSLWEQPIGNALSLYWSGIHLEHIKTDLSLYEFAFEIFRNIGAMIEGTLQVYLKEILHLALAHNRSTSFDDINSLGLGVLVQRLGEILDINHLLTIVPWNVPLNQWRNIAQHFSIKTDGSTVECAYGSRNQHILVLTRPELLEVTRCLFLLFCAIRTSHTIFFLDNADALISHCKGFKRREPDELFQFAVGAASQGFEVTDLQVNEDASVATLIDVSNLAVKNRAIHASQFVYQLWVATRSKRVSVLYRDRSGKDRLRNTVDGNDCEKVFLGEEEFSYLARVAKFEPQKT